MFSQLFTEHPRSVGESYFQHMGMAFGFTAWLALAALACAAHVLLPFMFERKGSQIIEALHETMVRNRRRHAVEGLAERA